MLLYISLVRALEKVCNRDWLAANLITDTNIRGYGTVTLTTEVARA